MPDMVNHPPHYTAGPIECIDAIAAALGPEGFQAYCRGTAIKYAWRAGLKDDAAQDLDKGAWYLKRGAQVKVEPDLSNDRELAYLEVIANLKQKLQEQDRQWMEAQDSLRAEWLKVVDVLGQIVPVIEGETTLGMVERVLGRVIQEEKRRYEAETHNQELMKRLDAALASIQDVHSILGTEIANEGIRLVAMRVKGERDEAKAELEVIDAILGNRQVFDSCKSRAEKVGLAIRCASRGESLGPA